MAKYSQEVMKRVRQRLDLEEDDESCDLDIAAMSSRDILDHCLCWEGIIGFTDMIFGWISELGTTDVNRDTERR